MEPLIARAFVTLLLTPTRIAQVKEIENKLPPGRSLQAFEILQFYSLSGGEVDPQRESKMKMLFGEWQKKNWLKSQIEDKDHEKLCAGKVKPGEWCKCRTYQQEVHEWMAYVEANWFEPLPLSQKRRTMDKFQDASEERDNGDLEKPTNRHKQSKVGEVSQMLEGME